MNYYPAPIKVSTYLFPFSVQNERVSGFPDDNRIQLNDLVLNQINEIIFDIQITKLLTLPLIF